MSGGQAPEKARPSKTQGKKAPKGPKRSSEVDIDSQRGDAVRPEHAVRDFSAALEQVQQKDWNGATKNLHAFLERYPTAREFHDRARTYLKICERQLSPPSFHPASVDDHYAIGIVQLNRGELDEAVESLEKANGKGGDSDRAEMALAIAHAHKMDAPTALTHLRKAIALNPENRILAANDSDLQILRDEPEFLELTQLRTDVK